MGRTKLIARKLDRDPKMPPPEKLIAKNPTVKKSTIKNLAVKKLKKSKRVRDQKPFRFLDLPPEIRNHFYEIFTAEIIAKPLKHSASLDFLPFAQVCHQIRSEFLGHFYSRVEVNISCSEKYLGLYNQCHAEHFRRLCMVGTVEKRPDKVWIFTLLAWHSTTMDCLIRLEEQERGYGKTYPRAAIFRNTDPVPDDVQYRVINNRNPKWAYWIRKGALMHVSFGKRGVLITLFKRFGEEWVTGTNRMEEGPACRAPIGYAESIGLWEEDNVHIHYGLDWDTAPLLEWD